LLFSEYLHEKAEESRHNETVGYLIVIIGSLFFIGGLLVTVITVTDPQWFLIIPYHLTPNPYSLLSLSMTSVGLTLLIVGLALGIHYARERSWYMQELRKSHSMEEQTLKLDRKVETKVQWPEMAETPAESKAESSGQ
jgi:formate-dependent nitrite reductase membrane component NrfD